MTQAQIQPDELSVALDGRFVNVVHLQSGGQGTVFSATRTIGPGGSAVSDPAAIKTHLRSTTNAGVDREIDALQGFNHPCLAALVEHWIINLQGAGFRYIAWRFIDGSALDERMSSGPVDERAVACIGRDVARAIEHIWQRRTIHRDINPEDIMLSPP